MTDAGDIEQRDILSSKWNHTAYNILCSVFACALGPCNNAEKPGCEETWAGLEWHQTQMGHLIRSWSTDTDGPRANTLRDEGSEASVDECSHLLFLRLIKVFWISTCFSLLQDHHLLLFKFAVKIETLRVETALNNSVSERLLERSMTQ